MGPRWTSLCDCVQPGDILPSLSHHGSSGSPERYKEVWFSASPSERASLLIRYSSALHPSPLFFVHCVRLAPGQRVHYITKTVGARKDAQEKIRETERKP